MSQTESKGSDGKAILSALVIPIAIGIGFIIWKFVMGDPSGFEGGDPGRGECVLVPFPDYFVAEGGAVQRVGAEEGRIGRG